MPGHPVGESMLTRTLDYIQLLEKLVEEHDVIYMLTDSRESRWLPTLLGAYHNKVRQMFEFLRNFYSTKYNDNWIFDFLRL